MATEDKVTETTKEEEARSLAREAVDEQRHGNDEEAKFLADEARALDPKAADSVLKDADDAADATKGAAR